MITGIKIFTVKKEDEYDPQKNIVYRRMKKMLPIHNDDTSGRFTVSKRWQTFFYTAIFVVIVLLATTDIVFALDSIPAVFAISQDRLVIYTSNVFAVLGLRSLFFLLQGAINQFQYLQQGIAIVLIFIGLKMLGRDGAFLHSGVGFINGDRCLSFRVNFIFCTKSEKRDGMMEYKLENIHKIVGG